MIRFTDGSRGYGRCLGLRRLDGNRTLRGRGRVRNRGRLHDRGRGHRRGRQQFGGDRARLSQQRHGFVAMVQHCREQHHMNADSHDDGARCPDVQPPGQCRCADRIKGMRNLHAVDPIQAIHSDEPSPRQSGANLGTSLDANSRYSGSGTAGSGHRSSPCAYRHAGSWRGADGSGRQSRKTAARRYPLPRTRRVGVMQPVCARGERQRDRLNRRRRPRRRPSSYRPPRPSNRSNAASDTACHPSHPSTAPG